MSDEAQKVFGKAATGQIINKSSNKEPDKKTRTVTIITYIALKENPTEKCSKIV